MSHHKRNAELTQNVSESSLAWYSNSLVMTASAKDSIRFTLFSYANAPKCYTLASDLIVYGQRTNPGPHTGPLKLRTAMAFDDTRWSLVLRAGSQGDGARQALESLCQQYWPPLYSFLRARGYSKEDASDLVQGFFLAVIEKDIVKLADPRIGRFRTFLLTVLTRHVSNEDAKRRAIKRGGKTSFVTFDSESAEMRHQRVLLTNFTPEEIYERQWAMNVLQQAMDRLSEEFGGSKRERLFEDLRATLIATDDASPYAEIAQRLGMSEGAVRVAAHRMKRRYREALSDIVAETVASPDDVQDEIRYLITVLSRGSAGSV